MSMEMVKTCSQFSTYLDEAKTIETHRFCIAIQCCDIMRTRRNSYTDILLKFSLGLRVIYRVIVKPQVLLFCRGNWIEL